MTDGITKRNTKLYLGPQQSTLALKLLWAHKVKFKVENKYNWDQTEGKSLHPPAIFLNVIDCNIFFPLASQEKGRNEALLGCFIWGSGNSLCTLGWKFLLSDVLQNNSFVARTVTVPWIKEASQAEGIGRDFIALSKWLGRRVQCSRGSHQRTNISRGKRPLSVSCGHSSEI